MIGERIRQVLAAPMTSDDVLDPDRELDRVLATVGLTAASAGGSVTFTGKDPILKSPWPLATMGGVALMAKAVAVADLWRYRTGQGQDLSLDLRRVPHRLCPFYDQKWELLNGYPPGAPGDPTNPFMPTYMYPTRDGRWIQLLNTYPKAKTRALAFLDCADNYPAIEAVTRTWNSFDLEEQANRHGLQATVVRSTEEFLELDQFRHLAAMPLVTIEKIADSAPEPLGPDPTDTAGRCPGPRPRARHRRRRTGPRPGLPRRRRPEHLATAGLRDRHRLLHLQRRNAFRHHRFRPNPRG